ncbi:MAG: phenylalanine--tRNA ligase subunit beta [Desulfobacteraceae bacterium 4572_89]|nr:MAG: phenylalanine--tRNA ligase subunit beta [Desulfobacteraceae bacterium 4572_89]
MKVSLSWLKEYIPVDLDPLEISDRLTMAGLEVDSIENLYDYLDNVVVARIDEVKQHPNADKLSCCLVDAGKDDLVQIVCGAPNVREGMYVPCALPGAVLPGEFKIKKSKLRGEKSHGMLCSGSELRLAADASGIMDLEQGHLPGTPLEKALDLTDTVFEIDLTPNRPDCLSMIGVAREVGAFTEPRGMVKLPEVSLPEEKMAQESIHDFAKVEIKDPDLCPRYSAGLLFDVKVEPSPFWLRQKLESVGLTPINNIVDITNFVMLETGQPLHAFDFDNLARGQIVVKRAGKAIDFTTLDNKEHKLESEMLMICDGERPVALAGVMGGENSEISDTTTRVLIESAYFNPISIRRTAKKTGIATDASHRFERGIDPEGTVYAMKRAVSLIAEVCDASIARDIIDEHPLQSASVEIDLNIDALNTRLGTDFSIDVVQEILESVEFDIEKTGERQLKVKVPSFRVDVLRPEDLSEEVARLWGYNNIKTSYPLVSARGKALAPVLLLRERIRQAMIGFSFYEAINYNFIHEESCDRLRLVEADKRRAVERILNPISDQMSVLRTSLVPGLLDNMKRNNSQQTDTIKIFEIGKTFFATQKGDLPEEKEMLAGLITGNRSDQSWFSKKAGLDFFDLKGVVEGLLDELFIRNVQFLKIKDDICPYFEMGFGAIVKVSDLVVGSLGKIDARVLKNYGLKQDAYVFDFDLAILEELMPGSVQADPLPRFPSVSRDMTFIVDQSIEVGSIIGQLKEKAEKQTLVEDIFLFDVFEGKPLKEGKKSLSFRLVYRSPSKTLTEKNIKKLHTNLSRTILKEFNADLPE